MLMTILMGLLSEYILYIYIVAYNYKGSWKILLLER